MMGWSQRQRECLEKMGVPVWVPRVVPAQASADWMIVGEALDADAEQSGEQGQAGRLLNNMLAAIGLQREQVFIANLSQCLPNNNAEPLPEAFAHSEKRLQQQIALVQPKLLLVFGEVVAQNLLKTDVAISNLRGQAHLVGEKKIPLVVTIHPNYLLQFPKEKAKAWQDLLFAKQLIQSM